MKDRSPAVAGAFYPSDPKALKSELENLFSGLTYAENESDISALIVPHAGYHFSGKVAASAYSQLNPEAYYENIFLIGASHRKYYEGVSVYPSANYLTPLGKVRVNEQITLELMKGNHFIYFDPEADYNEHALEVQLPFLQYQLKNSFKIVPLMIGNRNKATYKSLAEALKPWFTKDNLFIISTDFAHYPLADKAEKIDLITADAIVSGDPERVRQVCKEIVNSGINNLSTALCGEMAVLTLLAITQSHPEITYRKIKYQNSGQALNEKEKNKVVGYWSIGAYRPKDKFEINDADKKELLRLAKESITAYIETGSITHRKIETNQGLGSKYGVFVSIYKHGNLRGCIGRLESKIPIWQLIQDMAIAAASTDPRFDPVKSDEFSNINIEISLLSPLRKIYSIEQLELGKHGIYMKQGENSGTFLPQVAEKRDWTKEEFLGHCARDKAKIGWDGWKNAELFTFEAIVFHD